VLYKKSLSPNFNQSGHKLPSQMLETVVPIIPLLLAALP